MNAKAEKNELDGAEVLASSSFRKRRLGSCAWARGLTAVGLFAAGTAMGQFDPLVNPDGAFPVGGLVLAGDTLYGAAQAGGRWGDGVVFSLKTDGSDFTTLHSFDGVDGNGPLDELMISNNLLYGTVSAGGSTGAGAVFTIKTNGSGYMTLYNFDAPGGPSVVNNDGANPAAGLVLSGNTLYGATAAGGTAGLGAIFAVNTDGSHFTNLHSCTATGLQGTGPLSGLALSGRTLYGTAYGYYEPDSSTVFSLDVSGTGFISLHNFTALRTNELGVYTNKDGACPSSRPVLSGGTLYATAEQGGVSGNGTLFTMNTDGTGFRVLHTFNGAAPRSGLVLSGGTLYGTDYGGTIGSGGIFAIKTDGTGFTNIYGFSPWGQGTNTDGALPSGTLLLSGNRLYGTALFGGDSDNGTVFAVNTDGTGFKNLHSFSRLAMPLPQLSITTVGTNLLVAWPFNTGWTLYSLESTEDILSPSWSPVSFSPDFLDERYVATLPLSAQTQFFRLNPFLSVCPICAKGNVPPQ